MVQAVAYYELVGNFEATVCCLDVMGALGVLSEGRKSLTDEAQVSAFAKTAHRLRRFRMSLLSTPPAIDPVPQWNESIINCPPVVP